MSWGKASERLHKGYGLSDISGLTTDEVSAGIIHRLQAEGFQALYVGGCVRDALLGVSPKDWDIATSATPEEVEALFEHTVPVGKSFGVMVVVEDGREYEVATFRKDGGYSDGRRPESVEYTDAREDALRRDFTINALMYDPVRRELLDFVGGQEDLKAGVVRAVGEPEQRFLEDHLRMLRAVRFAARTGFAIEPATFRAIRELAGLVTTVSAERIGAELLGMFTCRAPDAALVLLEESRLLRHVLPEVSAMLGMPQPPEFHPEGDVFEHTRLMLKMLGAELPAAPFEREVLGWAVLLHDVGKPLVISVDGRIRFNCHDSKGAELATTILQRLKRPTKVIETVSDMIGRHMHFGNLSKMRLAKLRRFLREPAFPLHLTLHRYDCGSSHRIMENYEFGQRMLAEELAKPEELEPILKGADLIAMGFAPGPLFGKILEAVEDARLEGEISTPDQARLWVRNHYRKQIEPHAPRP